MIWRWAEARQHIGSKMRQTELQRCAIGKNELKRRKVLIWIAVGVVASAAAIALVVRMHRWSAGAMRIKGAVIRRDSDSRRELPISDVVVTASDGATSATTKSTAAGYFNLPFRGGVWPGQTVILSFSHPDYEPLDIKLQPGFRVAAKELYVAAMVPKPDKTAAGSHGPPTVVSNIRVRYTVNSPMEVNIGSAVRTFQVVNKGNVPCDHHSPCSPDGNWKAATNFLSLDAGVDNEFGNVRASCIAGPCPFTKIDSSGFVQGGRYITVSALNWSDTATFLLEAEVRHTSEISNVREFYPVVFGQALNFTLPQSEEGVSLEAEVDGAPMVFPLGPDLYLSWATCTASTNGGEEKGTVYRCELKPGYRF
jgi:hypothetical protein